MLYFSQISDRCTVFSCVSHPKFIGFYVFLFEIPIPSIKTLTELYFDIFILNLFLYFDFFSKKNIFFRVLIQVMFWYFAELSSRTATEQGYCTILHCHWGWAKKSRDPPSSLLPWNLKESQKQQKSGCQPTIQPSPLKESVGWAT